MPDQLPHLPRKILVNEYLNIVPHDARDHAVNANANVAQLWAEAVKARGFDPDGVSFTCGETTQFIQVRADGSVHIHASR